jgi:hypothetical protein
VVEVHEGVGGPKFLAQFLASDDVAGALEQERENLERLLLQTELPAVLRSSPALRSSSNTPKRAILLLFCGTGMDDAVV